MVQVSNSLKDIFAGTHVPKHDAIEMQFFLSHAQYLSDRGQRVFDLCAQKGLSYDVIAQQEFEHLSAIDAAVRDAIYSKLEKNAPTVKELAGYLKVARGTIIKIQDKKSYHRSLALTWLEQIEKEISGQGEPERLWEVKKPAVEIKFNPDGYERNQQLAQVRATALTTAAYIEGVISLGTWEWDAISIGSALYGFGAQSEVTDKDAPAVERFLRHVVHHMSSSSYQLNEHAISNACYALRSIDLYSLTSQGQHECGQLLNVLAEKISASPDVLSNQNLGVIFHSFQNIDPAHLDYEGRGAYGAMLNALASKVTSCYEPLDSHSIGLMMHGLKHIDLERLGVDGKESVGLLLAALATKMQESSCMLSGSSIGHALYGLHTICPGRLKEQGRVAYAELLEALAEKIVLSDELMSAQSLGLGLYGLRSIDLHIVSHNNYAGLTTIMRAMAQKIDQSSDEFTAQDIGNALTGIRNIDTALLNQDARDAYTTLLGSLATKVKESTEALDSQSVARALYSLKSVSLSSLNTKGRHAVGRLMHGIASTITKAPPVLGDVEVANALYGLNGLDHRLLPQAGQNAFRYMLAYLATQPMVSRQEAVLSQSLRALSNMTAHDVHIEHQASFQRLAHTCLRQLHTARLSPIAKLGILEDLLILEEHAGIASQSQAQKLFQGLEHTNLDDPFVVLGLVQIYSLYKQPVPDAIRNVYTTLTLKQGSSSLETSVAQSLQQDGLLSDVETSIFLNGFELDIASKTQKINVEIDGRRHDAAGSKSKDRLRDAFFARYGWTVLRVPARYGMNAEQVVADVRAALATQHRDSSRSNDTVKA